MRYRREIDGLRALAVVPVILFHAGFSWFGGGFVGVDIFFVISGFLITSIIIAAKESRGFSIADFYERRARRILPALVLVVCCTIPAAWLWMPPHKLREFSTSLGAVALFSSNFLFWSETGYFATAAVEKPLLHTWSLAIEEQFYILYPLCLTLLWPLGRRAVWTGLGLAAAASLGLALWGFPSDLGANFFLLPSRAWELVSGSLVAIAGRERTLEQRAGPLACQFLSGAGLVIIIVAIFFCDGGMRFPGFWTLLPVGGTCLVLGYAGPSTVAAKMLSPSWLVKLGLLSYSAYLWHQPLFAFARLRSFDVPSPLVFGLLSVVSLALAYVSWRFVETPFRRPGQFSRRWIFSAGALSILVLLAFGLAGNIPLLVEAPYTAAQLAVLQPPKSTEDECPWQVPLAAFPAIESCGFGSGNLDAPVVLVGDSHAGTLLGALGSRLRERGIGGVFLRNGQCRVIPGVYRSDRTADRLVRRCEEADRVFMAYLRGLKPRAMVVAIRWTFQLYPVEGQIDELGFDNGEGGVEEETPREYVARDSSGVFVTAADAKAKAVRDVLLAYAQLGVPVVVQYPVPEVGWNVPDLNFKHLLAEGEFPQSITTDHERYKRRHAFITAVLDGLADDHFIAAVRPDTLLCGQDAGGRCLAQRDGVPLYFDDDHLSREGSLGVADEIVKNIP